MVQKSLGRVPRLVIAVGAFIGKLSRSGPIAGSAAGPDLRARPLRAMPRYRLVRSPRPIRGGCDARVFTPTNAPVSAERVRAIVAALDGDAGRSAARNRPPRLR